MKFAIVWLCLLHLAFVSAELFSRNDLQTVRSSNVSSGRAKPQQRHQSPSTGPLNRGRQRPLFARRGQYERQRIFGPKNRVAIVPQKDVPRPTKAVPKPVRPKCSHLTQSCLPHSGCCDSSATCHCRFFNAICFCRRTNL